MMNFEVSKKIPPSLRILDCTLRDGGLVNDSNFDDSTASAIYSACRDAKIDYVELGFKNSAKYFSTSKFGKWRFCKDDDIRELIGGQNSTIKIVALVDAGKCELSEIAQKKDSPVDMIRCAFYEPDSDIAVETVNECSAKGYETALCMMAASTIDDSAIDRALEKFSESKADVIYLMDSFGGLMPDSARELSRKYKATTKSCGKLFGIHAHNNLQCAFANTLAAIDEGADIADCTIGGLGKGAGNCPTEMLAAKLGEKYLLPPVLKTLQNYIEPMKSNYRWGFDYPYMMTGLLNIHPRDAMEFEKSIANGETPSIVGFYDIHFDERPNRTRLS